MLTIMEPKTSRDQRIREEFDAVGGSMTTVLFAQHCINAGVWKQDELDRFALSHAQSEVRRALKKADGAGLPFAGQTHAIEDGAHLWTQRKLWVYEDYAINVAELVTQRDTMHWQALALADECRDRYGHAPMVDLPGTEARAAD